MSSDYISTKECGRGQGGQELHRKIVVRLKYCARVLGLARTLICPHLVLALYRCVVRERSRLHFHAFASVLAWCEKIKNTGRSVCVSVCVFLCSEKRRSDQGRRSVSGFRRGEVPQFSVRGKG